MLKSALSDKVMEQIAGYKDFVIRSNDVFIEYETPAADTIACNNFINVNYKEDVV